MTVGLPLADDDLVFLVAGEPSGDMIAAHLMAALKRLSVRRLRFVGVGGERMAAEGLVSLFPIGDLAVMGVTEVLPRARRVLRRVRETAAAVASQRPAVVVTIDSPAFSFRVAQKIRPFGIPMVHYVAPTVWAWRPRRAKMIARRYDHLLALLPFEPPYFTAVGLPCTFVGHPALEEITQGDAAGFKSRHGIPTNAGLLAVLPGSRRGEVARLLPIFGQAVSLLAKDVAGLHVVIPTVDLVAGMVKDATAGWPVPVTVVRGAAEKRDAFAASQAALAASGTVAVELAAAGVPAVIAYRVSWLSAWIVRRMVKVRFANLVNLLLDRMAVPERLQEECRPDLLAADILRLLDDPAAVAAQRGACAEALAKLRPGAKPPSDRAAEAVLELLERRRKLAPS
ncbi:MAG: lipid-A-disaccharide synthase [Rhodospirillaceae bacterium]|nr:lipid-A-disaccharide synthase [Rhodospirillaceae bacterium]